MKQVIDRSGNLIPNIFRDSSGALVVKDLQGLNRSEKEKERIEKMQGEINELKLQLSSIHEMLKKITNG